MSVATALALFVVAAGLLTITPGLDTALVLRTAAVEGARRAALAALGVVCGCLAWGAAVALGLGVLLAASESAYTVLKWAGAAYLAWLGVRPHPAATLEARPGGRRRAARELVAARLPDQPPEPEGRRLLRFLPAAVRPRRTCPAAPFIFLLAAIHAVLGMAWFALLIAGVGAPEALAEPRGRGALAGPCHRGRFPGFRREAGA